MNVRAATGATLAAMVPLRVHLLGGLEVEGVAALDLGSRKGRAVLRRLAAAAGAVVAEEALLDVAWPDGHPVRARDQLAVLVSRLRAVLGRDRLLRQDAGYRLVTAWLDITELATALDAQPLLPPAKALERGRDALQLVRGPLLPEDDAEWAEGARAEVGALVQALRRATAEAALATGQPREAADLARTCLTTDPYDEEVLRLLMSASLAGGMVSSGLAAYEQAAQRLADELGVDPSPETRAVHLRLLDRTAAPVAAPVVGRQELVAEVLAGLASTPALHLVTGAAGMGKSTLLQEAAAAATGVVVRVQAEATGLDLPLQPVLDALALANADAPLLGPAAVLAPMLAPAGSTGSTATRALEVSHDRAALAAGAGHLLAGLGRGEPVLVLVDDGHQLDPASAALLQHLCRPASRLPVLVVVAARPGSGPEWHPTRRTDLTPLTVADAALVVGEARAPELHRRSGGHPLFLSELARSGGELGDDVLAAVGRRFSRSPELTDLLRAAAVLGATVDVDLLADVTGRPLGEVLDQLDAAVAQQLLTATPDGYAFVHDLHREALAHAVTPARATALHRAAAHALAARQLAAPGRLSHHALAGGDGELAAGALAAAAEVAAVRYENAAALALLDRAVALAPTPQRRLQRARALVLVGSYAEADAEALAADTAATRPAALEVRALSAYLARDIDAALALAREAAATATDPELAAGCLALAARIALGRGDLDTAEADLREALALSTGPVKGVVTVWLSLTLVTRGDATGALAVIRSPAVRQVRSMPLVEPHRGLALGRALAMTGQAAEALQVFDQLAATVEEQQVRRFAGRAENYRGWVLRNLGAAGPAHEANLQAWEAVQALDELSGAEARCHAVLDLADHALRAGDLGDAEHWVGLARKAELAPHVMQWRFDLRRDLLAGRLALAGGDPDRAEELAERVRAGAAARGLDRFAVQAELLTARARARRGARVGGLPPVERLVASAPLEAWWLLGELATDLDDDGLRHAAGAQVDALLVGAGPWAADLRRGAAQLLG